MPQAIITSHIHLREIHYNRRELFSFWTSSANESSFSHNNETLVTRRKTSPCHWTTPGRRRKHTNKKRPSRYAPKCLFFANEQRRCCKKFETIGPRIKHTLAKLVINLYKDAPKSADIDGVGTHIFTSPRVPVRSWNRLHLATNAPSALFSRPPRQFQLFYWFPICRERESRSEISRAHYFGAARREIDGDELLEQLPIKSYWLMQQSPPPRNAPALRAIREIDGHGERHEKSHAAAGNRFWLYLLVIYILALCLVIYSNGFSNKSI